MKRVKVEFPDGFYIKVEAEHRGHAWNPACDILREISNIEGVDFGGVVNLTVKEYSSEANQEEEFTIRTNISNEKLHEGFEIPKNKSEIY